MTEIETEGVLVGGQALAFWSDHFALSRPADLVVAVSADADFLASVAGLVTKDVKRRALEMDVPEIGRLRVMHPIDVLDSRIQNLALIPSKRTPAGVSQARLAIDVARAFIDAEIDERGERKALHLLERIAVIAADNGAIRVFLRYGIDPLVAVPIEEFRTSTALHSDRWPRIVAALTRKRDKFRQLLSRPRPKRKV